ncbi:hypothetical protein [Kangiella geojedonensis]|uniref:Uncharacterized protein n=1 Tax=Kangiella geojedonensis TaxID=914150 RepID=A0A0F6RD18_9GAMM|nr:hypothetical protein [Kangiella geojedonensis]AKE52893.1 hypothetical protein TQ33_1959 [Kangiella geojedonensis]
MFVLRSTHDRALGEIRELGEQVETLNHTLNVKNREIEELGKFKGIAELQSIQSLRETRDELNVKVKEIKFYIKKLIANYKDYRVRIEHSDELKSINTFVQKLDGHGSGKIKKLLKKQR